MEQTQNQTSNSVPTTAQKPNNKLIIIIIAIVVVLGIGGFAIRMITQKTSEMMGKQAVENMIESATGGQADVDINSESVTITTDEGTFTAGADLPADLPQDVPVYPGAAVTYSGTSNTGSGTAGFGVLLSTSDDQTKVAEYYTRELPGQGWEIESTQKITGTTVMIATKDTCTLSVAASTTEEGTSVTLGLDTGSE